MTSAYGFTDGFRRTLSNARALASANGHEHIGTEHLLLALLKEPDGVTTSVLIQLGVDAERIGGDLSKHTLSAASQLPSRPDVPYTSAAKQALELAMSEASGLGDSHVGMEHLLIGIHRTESGVGAQALTAAGLTADALRAAVVRVRGSSPPGP